MLISKHKHRSPYQSLSDTKKNYNSPNTTAYTYNIMTVIATPLAQSHGLSSKMATKIMKKSSVMSPTPFPMRVIMSCMYLEIFRLGVVYAYDVLMAQGVTMCLESQHNASGTCTSLPSVDLTAGFFSRASDACVFYTFTYAVDTILAFSGYMSMYKHRMKHIWEHHIPGGVFTGLSALFHYRMSQDIGKGLIVYPPSYVAALHVLVVAGLVSQACEFFWVFRNLVNDPEAWHWKVIQRLLGLILVTFLAAASNAVVVTFLHVKYTTQPWSYTEMVAFPVLCWLCMWIQPLYIMCHLKHLRRLFNFNISK